MVSAKQTMIAVLFLCTMCLSVTGQQRPRILEHPSDAIATQGEPLTLNCKATGRPQPDIYWYHNGSLLIPSERRVVLPEGSLFFLRVVYNKREHDTGIYWCEARSSAGIAFSNNATLQIAHLKDEFKREPQNTTALVGGVVTLNCTPPDGIPDPSVLWYKDKKLLDIRGKRLSLVGSGSLLISDVFATDSGAYECSAQNMAGRKDAKPAILKVLTPPRIVRGPSNTEVVEGDRIDIPCEINGDPKPLSTWIRDGKTLPEGRSRILLDNTLRIEDIRSADHGKYICQAHNDGGNISITIVVNVFAMPRIIEASSEIIVNEGENIKMMCQATGRPKAIIIWDKHIKTNEFNESINNTLIQTDLNKLSIKQATLTAPLERNISVNILSVQSPITNTSKDKKKQNKSNYEKFELNMNGELRLKNIDQQDAGWYTCAAINEAGSDVKGIHVKLKSTNFSDNLSDPSTTLSGHLKNPQNIFITSVIPVSSSSLDMLWEYAQTSILEQEMTIYYRPIQVNEPEGRLLTRDYFTIRTTYEKKIFRLSNLKPYTNYEIFATLPSGLHGSISNMRRGKTLDGPPSAPPTDVRVGVINNTAAYVRWSPPPKHLINGELTGYKIQIKSNITNKLLGQMSLNASTQSVVINSLSPGGRYIARVAPLTSGGLGPYSPPTSLHIDTSFIPQVPKSDPALTSWSITWLSGYVFGVVGFLIISLALITVLWSRKTQRNMKTSFPAPSLPPTYMDKEQAIWMKGSSNTVKQAYTYVLPPPPLSSSEYAEVTSINVTKINTTEELEPYATVILPEKRNGTHIDDCTHALSIANMNEICHTNQTSNDSYQKCDISPCSSGYNAPFHMPIHMLPPPPPQNTDGSFLQLEKSLNYITIRTNPTALSPRPVRRKISHLQSDWSNSQLPPPIPNFPHNWIEERQDNFERINNCWYMQQENSNDNSSIIFNQLNMKNKSTYSDTEYESESVLYEKLLRDQESTYFSEVGEPTEKYYRNVNMEFCDDTNFESSTPPPPCPIDSCPKKKPDLMIFSLDKNKTEKYMIRNLRLNTEFHTHIACNDKTEVSSVNNDINDRYDVMCSSDENEYETNHWRNRQRRSRSKSNDKRFFNKI